MKQLRKYQIEGANFLSSTPKAMLLDDPGLGKTATALTAAEGKTLVVCPALVKSVWESERNFWTPELDLTVTSYAKARTNDSLWRLASWDTVILDEAHNVKSRSAQQTVAVERIAQKTKRLWLLTGTPIPNWAYELYMPLKLIHPSGDKRFSSFWRWVKYWFNVDAGKFSAYDIGEELLEWWTWGDFTVWNNLDTLSLGRTRELVAPDLPPLTNITHKLPLGLKQRSAYRAMLKDFLLNLDGQLTLALNHCAQWVALRKLSTDVSAFTEAHSVLGNKFTAVVELLNENVGRPVVIFAYYRSTLTQLDRLAQSNSRTTAVIHGGIDADKRSDLIERFQAGKFDTLIASIEATAEGVTLTRADTCIMVERSPKPTKNEQAIRRLHRLGQTRPVTIHHLVSENTVDSALLDLLAAKTDVQISALTAREFLERYRDTITG